MDWWPSSYLPGTDVYMPPEAVKDKPVYTEKIDCFSFGVVAVQIVTRQFPKPGDRQVTLNDPRQWRRKMFLSRGAESKQVKTRFTRA